MKTRELPPIPEKVSDYERIEKRIKKAFDTHFYLPLLKELLLPLDTIQNDNDLFLKAIRDGQITVRGRRVSGEFNAEISRDLKRLGATWDRKSKSFVLPSKALPEEIKQAIAVLSVRFSEKLSRIDKRITQILPEQIAGSIQITDLFDSVLFKTDRSLTSSLKNITVTPELKKESRKKIAEEWQTNMDRWIKNFTEEQIIKLRSDVQKSVTAGNRRESLTKAIQKSYHVTEGKARFLARQETGLLMSKFKETRYQSAGVTHYKWKCVAGSKLHPVRPMHKKLDGKIFSWDNPPYTNPQGQRNNPGQDYNCRCTAIPIVRFK